MMAHVVIFQFSSSLHSYSNRSVCGFLLNKLTRGLSLKHRGCQMSCFFFSATLKNKSNVVLSWSISYKKPAYCSFLGCYSAIMMPVASEWFRFCANNLTCSLSRWFSSLFSQLESGRNVVLKFSSSLHSFISVDFSWFSCLFEAVHRWSIRGLGEGWKGATGADSLWVC